MDNETVISFLTQLKNMLISSPSWTDNAKKHADEAFYKAIKALQKQPVLDKVRAEIHATAEMHEDGNYYLRDEWIDEIFDKYKVESKDIDLTPTVLEANRQEKEKSYGVYEVYTWDDVSYRLIEKYATKAEAEARATEEKQKNREKFKPSESMPVSPFSYTVLSDTEYENLMNNA